MGAGVGAKFCREKWSSKRYRAAENGWHPQPTFHPTPYSHREPMRAKWPLVCRTSMSHCKPWSCGLRAFQPTHLRDEVVGNCTRWQWPSRCAPAFQGGHFSQGSPYKKSITTTQWNSAPPFPPSACYARCMGMHFSQNGLAWHLRDDVVDTCICGRCQVDDPWPTALPCLCAPHHWSEPYNEPAALRHFEGRQGPFYLIHHSFAQS